MRDFIAPLTYGPRGRHLWTLFHKYIIMPYMDGTIAANPDALPSDALLHALPKPSPGVRPVAVGNAFRQVAASLIAHDAAKWLA